MAKGKGKGKGRGRGENDYCSTCCCCICGGFCIAPVLFFIGIMLVLFENDRVQRIQEYFLL